MAIAHFQSVTAGGLPIIKLVIAANTNNYNIFTAAGSPSAPGQEVWVTLNSGVIVGSTSTATPAMTRGTGWGASSVVRIKVASGTGRIVGKGGAGGIGGAWWNGDAKSPFSRMGGGGGGGGGQQVGVGGVATAPATAGADGTAAAGGAGGVLGSASSISGTSPAGNGLVGGPALEAPDAGQNIELEPPGGTTLELWGAGGGAGGGGADSASSGNGGAGGAPANAGANGLGPSPGTGAAAGSNKIGAGAINNVGPGSIDEDGP